MEKQLINAGFVVYPRDVYIDFVERAFSKVKDSYAWGVDMILLNYYAYENGFFKLPVIYNFIPTTARVRYKIEDGIFYIIKNGEKIKVYVVHNAGGYKAFRPVLKFGYGKNYNIPRPLTIFTLRIFYIIALWFKTFRLDISQTIEADELNIQNFLSSFFQILSSC